MKLLLQNHKAFILSYVVWASLALVLTALSIALAVFSDESQPQSPINSMVKQVVPPSVQKEIANVLQSDESKEANLSPKQWKEIRDFLARAKFDFGYLRVVHLHAGERLQLARAYGDFVFDKYYQFPEQTRSDWRVLKKMDLDSISTTNDNIAGEKQEFITATLNVKGVMLILEQQKMYETIREQIDASSKLIDRIVPVLVSKGLQEDLQSGGHSRAGVGLSLKDFIGDASKEYSAFLLNEKYAGVKEKYVEISSPPAVIPPFSFTSEQVIQQLSQHPLSQGLTSADRAAR